eukprot:CAMPEP_0119050172 /NCGR_PEP_ID=MMETSP1177-20130426/68508_1 /TAXON_ID=2985 /ORGANISM="Ochromonas sp, Strain CCMP1899" /LENGTH=77 /DNA_ID=CAMNT_0007028263 /DNA_START=377 /DNA_END=613 /DNA_ORIENTATION=-
MKSVEIFVPQVVSEDDHINHAVSLGIALDDSFPPTRRGTEPFLTDMNDEDNPDPGQNPGYDSTYFSSGNELKPQMEF